MDKEGRDIVNSVAAAARLEGKFAQAMENNETIPTGINAPTRSMLHQRGVDRKRVTTKTISPTSSSRRGDDGQGGMRRCRPGTPGDQHAPFTGT
jgi:hypothetical protein